MIVQYLSGPAECSDFFVEKNGDVLVLAGDIFNHGSQHRFEMFLDRTMALGFRAVLFVLGNHEGYGWSISEAKAFLQKMDTQYADFWFLDRSGIVIGDQRFIGASLWSYPDQHAKILAQNYINDYRVIKGWTIKDHMNEHTLDLQYLCDVIREGDVVITHFPPTNNGVAPRFVGDPLNRWFVNDLDIVIKKTKPQLWISGHTHHIWDEMVHDTRDTGNCRGY